MMGYIINGSRQGLLKAWLLLKKLNVFWVRQLCHIQPLTCTKNTGVTLYQPPPLLTHVHAQHWDLTMKPVRPQFRDWGPDY